MLQNASGSFFPSPQSSKAVRWIALIVWALIAVANLIKFVLDLISDYSDMLIPCPSRLGSGGECNFVAVSSVEMDVLSSWGLTPHAYATAMTIPPVILMLVYGALAGLILWRQAVSWLGLIVSLTLIVFPVFVKAGDNDWSASSPFFLFIALVIGSTTGIIVIAFLYLIPNGRFAPRWAYIPMIVTCVLLAVMNLDINRVIVLPTEVMNLVQVALVGLVLFGASLQIYRYVANITSRRTAADQVDSDRGALCRVFIHCVDLDLWQHAGDSGRRAAPRGQCSRLELQQCIFAADPAGGDHDCDSALQVVEC